jgi:cell wall-associated protease
MFKFLFSLLTCCLSLFLFAQDSVPQNWSNLDVAIDKVAGVSSNRAYEALLDGKTPKSVVIAVIDSGVDIEHEDLEGSIWVNKDEIPDNGIDDDLNGYVDDINGWNFIGGASENVVYDNLEFTRIYKDLKSRLENISESSVPEDQKVDYKRYLAMKDQYAKRVAKAETEAEEFFQIQFFYELSSQQMVQALQDEPLTYENLMDLNFDNEQLMQMRDFLLFAIENNLGDQLAEGEEHFSSMLAYSYNLDYDSRAIVGDDPNNLEEKFYGNNHLEGTRAEHGTHVAGIIAANRNNEIGIDGVSDAAQIMVLRVVPMGDERDKDVANAIYYAVDNGAKIINMSFGKSYSPQKYLVDKAIQYAASKDVLLVHASGNHGRNNDKSTNFPNPVDEVSRELCPTWIEVGASTQTVDEHLAAEFSNYGKKSVDVFAPGHEIYSLAPDNQYKTQSGTSMAAPVVSGVAAILFSYFPDLTAKDVREIVVNSCGDYGKLKVLVPGTTKKKKFKRISRTGGVVNAYNAVKMASEYEQNLSK